MAFLQILKVLLREQSKLRIKISIKQMKNKTRFKSLKPFKIITLYSYFRGKPNILKKSEDLMKIRKNLGKSGKKSGKNPKK